MAILELFPLINEKGEVIGKATRQECHSGSKLLHPVIHLHILSPDGKLFMQKRSMSKDIQPGKWDTAVGGHVDYGETVEDAMKRESYEELGIKDFPYSLLFSYIFESSIEREMVNTYITRNFDDKIVCDSVEIDEGRYWSIDEIKQSLGKEIFTPNFESEFQRLLTCGAL